MQLTRTDESDIGLEMLTASSNSDSVIICVLDNNPSTLDSTTQLLSSAGWQVRPFTHPDAILDYARNNNPQAAVVDFGGSRANGLEIANRLREVSPVTSVIISLKVHRAKAQPVPSGNELLNLVEQQCIRRSARFHAKDNLRS